MTKAINMTSPYKPLKLSIHSWAEEDRPREKLLLKGRHNLSDAELIAIILGSGSRQESAVDLAKRVLASVNNNLLELGKLTIADLTNFHGIGKAKAIGICAAIELSRRRQKSTGLEKPKITCSKDAHDIIAPFISDLPHEECWLLALNRANYVLQTIRISSGGVSGTVVDAKLVFGKALANKASSIILAHNHPSSKLVASQSDINLTKKIFSAGKTLDIPLLDHLIVSEKGYYSFADEGMLHT